jgi:hypothetical protein
MIVGSIHYGIRFTLTDVSFPDFNSDHRLPPCHQAIIIHVSVYIVKYNNNTIIFLKIEVPIIFHTS